MKRFALIAWLLVFAAISIQAQPSEAQKLTGLYLGQKPPGMAPEAFEPGIVSSSEAGDTKNYRRVETEEMKGQKRRN